jgi:hypothetical protein
LIDRAPRIAEKIDAAVKKKLDGPKKRSRVQFIETATPTSDAPAE